MAKAKPIKKKSSAKKAAAHKGRSAQKEHVKRPESNKLKNPVKAVKN
jgi:hypothetical protein